MAASAQTRQAARAGERYLQRTASSCSWPSLHSWSQVLPPRTSSLSLRRAPHAWAHDLVAGLHAAPSQALQPSARRAEPEVRGKPFTPVLGTLPVGRHGALGLQPAQQRPGHGKEGQGRSSGRGSGLAHASAGISGRTTAVERWKRRCAGLVQRKQGKPQQRREGASDIPIHILSMQARSEHGKGSTAQPLATMPPSAAHRRGSRASRAARPQAGSDHAPSSAQLRAWRCGAPWPPCRCCALPRERSELAHRWLAQGRSLDRSWSTRP